MTRSVRRPSVVAVIVALVCAILALAPASAEAATAAKKVNSTTVVTKSGQSLTVTPVRGLSPTGAVVKVTGKGYSPVIGIYVALCVTPAKGKVPTPCGGGINTTGTSPASFWISSNPPPYGTSLAIPFRKGGRFSVTMQVSSVIGDVDCRTVSCSIVTRADHTRPGDRSADVIVPVTFLP